MALYKCIYYYYYYYCGRSHTNWLREIDTDVLCQHQDPLSLEKGQQPHALATYRRHGNTPITGHATEDEGEESIEQLTNWKILSGDAFFPPIVKQV